jgi:2-dehydro-3-deoxyphosphogluconate aldolase/(4S)-4-hydroxy-2-oxoglutarate aldolase
MPVLAKGVANYCRKKKIPFFPGALSPQEIYEAWCSGAAMVKVFPAGSFGPAYFKEIKGPFKEIELLACSGVTAENIGQYFANGANAVAFGTSVFKQEWLKSKNFSKITQAIKELIDCLHKVS